ncbi:MAG TPA: signal peptidase II [Lachnospiraceae bacterium]|nr:signal peptidase II [Lachnospiraceae bacterium]
MRVNFSIRKKRNTMLSVLLLIGVDQAIKIIIADRFMDKEYTIIRNLLSFKPHINTKYSWFSSLTNIKVGLLPHLMLNALIIIILLVAIGFIKDRVINSKMIRSMSCILYAGVFCSLIDKIAWGGSLDYILLEGFFIFDLKDVYISTVELALALSLVFKYKMWVKLDDKLKWSEFKLYIKMKYPSSRI